MRAGGPFTRGAHTFQGVWAPEMVSKAGLGVSARPSLNAQTLHANPAPGPAPAPQERSLCQTVSHSGVGGCILSPLSAVSRRVLRG